MTDSDEPDEAVDSSEDIAASADGAAEPGVTASMDNDDPLDPQGFALSAGASCGLTADGLGLTPSAVVVADAFGPVGWDHSNFESVMATALDVCRPLRDHYVIEFSQWLDLGMPTGCEQTMADWVVNGYYTSWLVLIQEAKAEEGAEQVAPGVGGAATRAEQQADFDEYVAEGYEALNCNVPAE